MTLRAIHFLPIVVVLHFLVTIGQEVSPVLAIVKGVANVVGAVRSVVIVNRTPPATICARGRVNAAPGAAPCLLKTVSAKRPQR